jgi:hypothetical protein
MVMDDRIEKLADWIETAPEAEMLFDQICMGTVDLDIAEYARRAGTTREEMELAIDELYWRIERFEQGN